MYCRQTDGQDFLPLVRHLNDAAVRQRRFDVGAIPCDPFPRGITFQSDFRRKIFARFVDQEDRAGHLECLGRNLHLQMERSNFCRLSCGLDFETGRSDRDGVAQKFLEVLDGPFESDDSIMNSESFTFDEV